MDRNADPYCSVIESQPKTLLSGDLKYSYHPEFKELLTLDFDNCHVFGRYDRLM